MAYLITEEMVLNARDQLRPEHRGHAAKSMVGRVTRVIELDCACGHRLEISVQVVIDLEDKRRAEEEDALLRKMVDR